MFNSEQPLYGFTGKLEWRENSDCGRISFKKTGCESQRRLRKSPTGIRGLDEITVEPGVFIVQVRRMERGESDMGVLALARVARGLEKDLDWFAGDMRTLQEHTEGLWRKNANLTRAYPADLRFPAKKEILIGLGLWEPIGPASEKHGY